MLSYSILGEDGKLYAKTIEPKHLRDGSMDKALVIQCLKDFKNFDRLIGFYSTRFDIPFVRTRAVYHNLDFPAFGSGLKPTELYFILRNKFRLHSNRLENGCKFFGIKSKGHPLTPDVWIRCLSGNREALDYVLLHNIEDVKATKELWEKIFYFSGINNTSL